VIPSTAAFPFIPAQLAKCLISELSERHPRYIGYIG
jgi:hypothetical protein